MHSAKSHRVQHVHFDIIISFYFIIFSVHSFGWDSERRRMYLSVHACADAHTHTQTQSYFASGEIKFTMAKNQKWIKSEIVTHQSKESVCVCVTLNIVELETYANVDSPVRRNERTNYLNIWYPISIWEKETRHISFRLFRFALQRTYETNSLLDVVANHRWRQAIKTQTQSKPNRRERGRRWVRKEPAETQTDLNERKKRERKWNTNNVCCLLGLQHFG